MDQYIGRLLDDRYEILEIIGTGGMAVVYKARCHRLNRLVAIKILKDEFARDDEFRRRFHAEGEAVAMLSHPNIVQVYDVSSSDNANFIVMELIDGISLKQYMEKKGVLNWKETLHFAIQIAKALEHAHSRGIVHRDIKPHNVMVLKNGSVKVTDFGIARVMSKNNTLTKEALGSVHYISPEQAKGGRVDSRSDLYSLGVVMYEMITGRPPYDGESPVAVAIQHINGGASMPSTLNPNIPGGLEQIIMKAMAHDPGDRYANAAAMLYDMDEFRKDPAMLFDYHGAALEDVTRIHSGPLVTETPAQKPGQTAAERAAGAAAGEAVRRSGERNSSSRTATRTDRTNAGTRRVPQTRNQTAARRRREETEQQEEDRSRITMIAIISLSLVALLAIGIFLWTFLNGDFFGTSSNDLVEVPMLEGLNYEDLDRNSYEGLTIVLQDRTNSDKPAGEILSQEPKAYTEVVKGTKIMVVVSLGPVPEDTVLEEDLVGLDLENARNYLTALGVPESLILTREEYSTEQQAGKVTRTDPAVGETIPDGQAVTIWVSLGQEVVLARMPNVLGDLYDDAVLELNEAGFMDVTPEEVESNEPAGTVLQQSHERYVNTDVTTPIILTISKGPDQKVMPSVVGKSYDDAYKQLYDMGFLDISPKDVESNEPAGTVLQQTPEADTLQAITTPIELQVSKGPKTVTMPDLTGQTFEAAQKQLIDMGFTVVNKAEVEDEAEAGLVVGQSVEKNTEVTIVTEITLQVSTGPAVPDLVSRTVNVDLSAIFTDEQGNVLPEPVGPYYFELRDDEGQTVKYINNADKVKFTLTLEGYGLQTYEIYVDQVFFSYLTVDFR